MRNFLIFMVALSIFSGKAVAQRSCAAEEVLAQQLLNNPEMRQIRETSSDTPKNLCKAERFTNERLLPSR